MREYVLVSDSTADLPVEVVKELDVKIVPFSYTINDEVFNYYLDERDGDIKEFYDKLRDGAMPATAQVNPAVYKDTFESIIKEGKDVLYLSFSSGLSGSYQTSKLAASMLEDDYPDSNIVIVDSVCASIGQGVLLYEAAKRKNAGASMDELTQWIENTRNTVGHWFMVEDLFHLMRGGRLSAVGAVVGSALKIKPILSVDEEGKLVVKSKARGTNKALDFIISKLKEDGGDLTKLTAIVGHADDMEKAEKIKRMAIEAGILPENIRISSIGPIIGTHVGPGMAALTFVTKM